MGEFERIASMAHTKLIDEFRRHFGAAPEVQAQAPGRINLMGRHVDHQGGDVNMLAVDRYVRLAVSRGPGPAFRFRNLDPVQYPDLDFEPNPDFLAQDLEWQKFIERPEVVSYREQFPLWCRYLAGVVIRLSQELGRPLPTMDILVTGDLAPAAGLSSSAALVLSFVLAVDTLLDWHSDQEQLIKLSYESERFIGIRNGASDPAAMLASEPGRVVQIGCLPFSVKAVHPFPDRFRIILADSHDRAAKGGGVRNDYNWRVGAYRLARILLHRIRPQWAERAPLLRDLAPDLLGVSGAEIYRALRELPELITREELLRSFPENRDEIEEAFIGHTMPEGGYPLREILLYGLAEMARSRRMGELLHEGDYASLGRWINVSHDGDRVSRLQGDVRCPWRPPVVSDSALEELFRASEQSDPSADLAEQTGAYLCSTPNVDAMVDLCLGVDGCLGAQILGGGLGGCIMALVESSAEQEVIQSLESSYYAPRALSPEIWSIVPAEGAKVERVDQ